MTALDHEAAAVQRERLQDQQELSDLKSNPKIREAECHPLDIQDDSSKSTCQAEMLPQTSLRIMPSWRTEPFLNIPPTGHPHRHTIPDLLDVPKPNIVDRLKRRESKARRKRKTYADVDDDDEDEVIVGTKVTEGHKNYTLIHDMITGIRIAVGRVSAKMRRDLTPQDFTAAHKLVFDVTGNELTPGVKYDFKFKDYAPWVFRALREKFHIDAADYMMSLTNKHVLSEVGSSGKSGSFFYFSRDYRFIIKTIHHSEHKFLMKKLLKRYYEHVCNNPNTLMCRLYGLHRIKLPRGRKIHFIIMGNVYPANKDIHERFDLKGSMYGRYTDPDPSKGKESTPTLKDQNWVELQRKLELGPLKRQLLIAQLERDVRFLQELQIMDYSLLVGIHDLKRGNTEGLRDHRLQKIEPKTKDIQRQMSYRGSKRESKAELIRQALKRASTQQLDPSELPASPSEERRYCIFFSEEGGYRSTDENNTLSGEIYYMSIIDIFTQYNYKKKAEHFWKSWTQDKHSISAVDPNEYADRFMRFIKNTVTAASDLEEDEDDGGS